MRKYNREPACPAYQAQVSNLSSGKPVAALAPDHPGPPFQLRSQPDGDFTETLLGLFEPDLLLFLQRG